MARPKGSQSSLSQWMQKILKPTDYRELVAEAHRDADKMNGTKTKIR